MQIGSNGAGSTLQKVDYTSIDLNLGAFGGDKIWYYRQGMYINEDNNIY